MKLGLYLATQFTAETDVSARLAELIEQVRVARESGFASLWVPHHYLTAPMQMLQPMPMLAYLLRDAPGMTIGTNILIMPLLNPVHVAEEAATLDLVSEGRLVLGVGLGYRDGEFEAFNVPINERTQRLAESIGLMRRLWSEDRVVHRGRFFSVDGLGVGLKPRREGGPPVWVAATVDAAVERAARIGDAWLITNFAPLDILKPQMRFYRETLREAGKAEADEFPIIRECYIGPNHELALEECRGPLQYKYGAYSSWGLDKLSEKSEPFDQPFEDFARDRFIIGDKVFAREEVERYREFLGVDHFIMRVQWPGLDQSKVLRTIRTLGELFG